MRIAAMPKEGRTEEDREGGVQAPPLGGVQEGGLAAAGWHALRHTFASHVVMHGAPIEAVQELMGHATIEMTMRCSHLSPDVRKDAFRLLDRPVVGAQGGHKIDKGGQVGVSRGGAGSRTLRRVQAATREWPSEEAGKLDAVDDRSPPHPWGEQDVPLQRQSGGDLVRGLGSQTRERPRSRAPDAGLGLKGA